MEVATDELVEAIAMLSIFDYLDVAYSGLTQDNTPMYLLASSDGAFAALVFEGEGEKKNYIKFIGSTTLDENGITTVIDSDKGYALGFIAEEQEGGSYILDCGNLGKCYLESEDTENVISHINTIFQEMVDATDEFMVIHLNLAFQKKLLFVYAVNPHTCLEIEK